jgi:hypothetical protein
VPLERFLAEVSAEVAARSAGPQPPPVEF